MSRLARKEVRVPSKIINAANTTDTSRTPEISTADDAPKMKDRTAEPREENFCL